MPRGGLEGNAVDIQSRLSPRSIAEVLAPLEKLSQKHPFLTFNRTAVFQQAGRSYYLPRLMFLGPRAGDEPLRVGLFAGLHGDEPEGVHALIGLLELLAARPQLAAGYCLFVYPICNPTGFERRTRETASGVDLNRQFWRGSRMPEVQMLQSDLLAHAFDGIISLHTDDTSQGFYGYAHGSTLTRDLIEPALEAAEAYLPRNRNALIDGFPASNGIIRDSFPGVLCAPPGVHPKPFEIILETPQAAPSYLKEHAFIAALQMILTRYREFMAYAPNL